MEPSHLAETEEYVTCLHIQLYHPLQAAEGVYDLLPLNRRQKLQAEDPLRLGRDEEACTFALADRRASRKQLAIQAFRSPRSSDLLFQVQNLSQRGCMSVGGTALEYLHCVELPGKALLRFGQYQLLICQEPGECQSKFEVEFRVSRGPLGQESGAGVPCGVPVMERGGQLPLNSLPSPQTPLETDEGMYLS
ncbi:TRAF-interacting protein with FHA domain-containing protein A [Conger conger]|uniref:TRAF-interacting protein with FHA domain-containing protein A n=1 Tax=Conger conger TaxID=82655 RepID=UPI002A599AD2|nr:TRAF-interacting protein with FHA domain-containing protein A [Conger conger]XP_061090759.1 TRAF-interacting protein with FHA domain-containing protein A [Conger conger]